MTGHINLEVEMRRTQPDYVVYRPKSMDGAHHDWGNEHFLVFDGPDGSLMAVWTQSTREGMPDQRIVFSRSPRASRNPTKRRTWSSIRRSMPI